MQKWGGGDHTIPYPTPPRGLLGHLSQSATSLSRLDEGRFPKCSATPQMVKQFMALLKKKSSKSRPLSTLLDEAGRLCQTLQDCPARMEKLEKAMAQSRHWEDLLTSIHVVQACVRLYMGRSQYSTACELLKSCRATEREQLVELWNEIHYRKMMEEWHRPSLTAVQRFRCRKRNPPPASLCPEGVKSRIYPRALRQKLQSFATEVTSNPSRKQRDDLAREFNLLPQHVYNWFANYRRRRKPGPSQPDEPVGRFGLEESACRKNPADQKTAGGLHEDAGVEQMEEPLGTCPPAQEQADSTQDCSSNRAFLVLQSSALQGEQSEDLEMGVEFPSLTRTADLTLLYLPTEPDSGTSRSPDPAEPRREQADPTAILWVQSPLTGPGRGCPTWPAARRAPGAVDRAVQCSLGSLDASVPLCLCLANLAAARCFPCLLQRNARAPHASRRPPGIP
ncbi:anomalous homeobox protein isoform X2 [Hemicordylus capensis]|uniref:anomalous homeobox protein isoform X2 n=1 Tax=Hemicordylus capensis TaxID=884348 RepID=UPI0023021AE4|nr:anomalous homeobox protein isoform X2 [Hemicordylus capensis]